MKKTDRTYVLGAVFAAATSLFYCCVRWFHIQLPRYYPLQRVWKWGSEPGVPSQGWYGMQAFAFLCGGILTLIVYFVLKHTALKDTELKPHSAKWLAIGATVIVVVCMTYILHYEYSKWGIL